MSCSSEHGRGKCIYTCAPYKDILIFPFWSYPLNNDDVIDISPSPIEGTQKAIQGQGVWPKRGVNSVRAIQ